MPEANRRSPDDVLAVAALLFGAVTTYLRWGDLIGLVGGVAMGLGGALIALRGERRLQARSWMRAALLLGAIATFLSLALGFWAEWIVGQWFAEGNQPGETAQEMRTIGQYANGMRIVATALGAMFLVGAAFGRVPLAPSPTATPAHGDDANDDDAPTRRR